MSESLADFLTAQQADVDTVLQGLRYYLAETTDDLSTRKMREVLDTQLGQAAVTNMLETLSARTDLVEGAALEILAQAWEEPASRDTVRRAVTNAKVKLPVIETVVLATAASYGMYLLATRGLKRRTRTVRKPDGTLIEEKEEYADPKPWTGVFESIFRHGKK